MRTPLSTFKKAPRRSSPRPASRLPPPPIRLTSKAPPPPPPDDDELDDDFNDEGIIVLDDVVTDSGFGVGTLVALLKTLFVRPRQDSPPASPRP